MNLCETPLTFQCHGEQLVGILHHPINPITRGLVIIVGGPQYRVGSHRQFTLLARDLARNRVPVIRFDYRGMGDSEGQGVTFEEIGPDIEAAIDILLSHFPSLKEVILWGVSRYASNWSSVT
jgi:pimeloyl-ACP methyl ester carboxylesterase